MTAVAVVLGAFGPEPVRATPTATLVQVSRDPFSTRGFEHATEVEPAIATDGRTVVSAFQVGRGQEGGAVDIGVAVSTNAGAAWSGTMLDDITKTTGGPFERASDPSVARDARTDSWMVGYLGITLGGPFQEPKRSAVMVVRSTDGGGSFGAPSTVARAPRGLVYDKPWVTCDEHERSPFYGTCYALWDSFGLRSGASPVVHASTSRDGGLHWSDPVRTADRGRGFGMVPVVRPDGSVVVVYLGLQHPLHPRVSAFGSEDGGAHWGASVRIAVQHRTERQLQVVRDPGLPAVTVDEHGTVWAAWSDCRFEPRCAVDDLVLSRSDDGASWSRPAPAVSGSRPTSASLVTPALVADEHGGTTRLAVVYYTVSGARWGDTFRPAPCAITIGFASSVDGGSTWGSPTTIGWRMKLGWFPPTRQGYMWGDYVSAATTNTGRVVTVLPLAHRPVRNLDVAMYAPVRGLPIRAHS